MQVELVVKMGMLYLFSAAFAHILAQKVLNEFGEIWFCKPIA
jgi:hypothetical protein